MKTKFFLSLALASLCLLGCDSEIDDLKTTRPTSNIPVTEVDGVITGTVSHTATSNQIMVASTSSKIADSSINFAPGSLTVSAEIALGEAGDKSQAILAELGVKDALKPAAAVYAGPTSANQVGIAEPLTIQLPLPLQETALTLAEDDGTSKLVLVYVIHDDDAWKSGMIPLTSKNLEGAFVKQKMTGLGYYQIVYLNSAAAAKDASKSNVRPGLAGKESNQK